MVAVHRVNCRLGSSEPSFFTYGAHSMTDTDITMEDIERIETMRLPLPKTPERAILRPTTTGNPGNVG
jgi:hypothetical protein